MRFQPHVCVWPSQSERNILFGASMCISSCGSNTPRQITTLTQMEQHDPQSTCQVPKVKHTTWTGTMRQQLRQHSASFSIIHEWIPQSVFHERYLLTVWKMFQKALFPEQQQPLKWLHSLFSSWLLGFKSSALFCTQIQHGRFWVHRTSQQWTPCRQRCSPARFSKKKSQSLSFLKHVAGIKGKNFFSFFPLRLCVFFSSTQSQLSVERRLVTLGMKVRVLIELRVNVASLKEKLWHHSFGENLQTPKETKDLSSPVLSAHLEI